MGFLKNLMNASVKGAKMLLGIPTGGANDANYNAQKEFAQMGIRWKVADAKAAGIHPLYALGANTVSFSPSYIEGGTDNALSRMGQNLISPKARGMTIEERQLQNLSILQERERLTQMQLETIGLRKALEEVNNTPAVPSINKGIVPSNTLGIIGQDSAVDKYKNPILGTSGLPILNPLLDSQGRLSGPIEFKPSQVEVSSKPGIAYGVSPMETFVRDINGYYFRQPSKEVKEQMEDLFFPEAQYTFKRAAEYMIGLLKHTPMGVNMSAKVKPPDNMKGDDEVYVWRPHVGAWQAVKKNKGRR